MKSSIFILIMSLSLATQAQSTQPEAWQFLNFFGTYSTQGSTCPQLNGELFIGYGKNSVDIPVLEIAPLFSTTPRTYIYLRNSESHGEDCYECDPNWWTSEVIGGDGIHNAVYTSEGVAPYSTEHTKTVLEIVKTKDERLFFKWDSCTAQLIKNK